MSFSRLLGFTLTTFLVTTAITIPANAAPSIKTQNAPGCKWIGTRVVQSLVRDDIVAANDYNAMYKSMACPARNLILAFSCTVKGVSTSNIQSTSQFSGSKMPEDNNSTHAEIPSRANQAKVTKRIINTCWDSPLGK